MSFTLIFMAMLIILSAGCKEEEKNEVPSLTSLPITDITETTAKSGGNISSDGGLPISARGICWGLSSNPAILDNKISSGSGVGSFTTELNGLEDGTLYYVRAYATNQSGTGYGNELSFQTTESINGTFTDTRDGTVYTTIKIGNQVWMAENLKYLPAVSELKAGSNTIPHYYVYGYNGTDVAVAKASPLYSIFGVLYNWSAAMADSGNRNITTTIQGVCPAGWHLPNDAEWTQLTDYLGGAAVAGGKLKETGYWHWDMPNTGATNESGFAARAAGQRISGGATLFELNSGFWWTASEANDNYAWQYSMSYNNSKVDRDSRRKELGFSVRCVKD